MHGEMIGAVALSWTGQLPVWIAVGLLATACASILLRGFVPRPTAWMLFALCVSAASVVVLHRLWPANSGAARGVADLCSVLALVWSSVAALVLRIRLTSDSTVPRRRGFVTVAHVVALLMGVVTAIIQSVVLAMRVIYVAIDLLNGYPYLGTRDYGFGPGGLWSLILLLAACAIGQASTGDRRLGTCQFWSAVFVASWACLLRPALQSTPAGGVERTGSTLLLMTVLSGLLALTVAVVLAVERWGRPVVAGSDGDSGAGSSPWPGLNSSATTIAVAVIFLVCYHLAVPIAVGSGGFRLTSLVVTASAALAGLASYLLVVRWWSSYLADAAMGLASLGLCALASLAVPSQPAALDERYPLVFSAVIVGFATAAWFWVWLASVWERQRCGDQAGGDSRRLIPHAKRSAFYCAALALVVGGVMAVWPRWPAIAATDDSLGRVSAGFAANLYLLLAMLWCSRKLRRLTFQILTVLTVVSTAGFLLARMLPFTSQFG